MSGSILTVLTPLGGGFFLEAYIKDATITIGNTSFVDGRWVFSWNRLAEVESHQPKEVVMAARAALRKQVKDKYLWGATVAG
jgi:hypothetical protein